MLYIKLFLAVFLSPHKERRRIIKKFIRNIALLLLPLAIYYCVFITFEPNNYFGLQAKTLSGSPIGVLRQYENNPQKSIILGDSRLAHFNMQQVQEVAGRPFANLAFGGASLKENLDLLDIWLEKYPDINEVVFGLSFYTINSAYKSDRMKTMQQSLSNPFVYLTSLSFNLLALENLVHFIKGNPLGGGELEVRPLDEYNNMASYTVEKTGETFEYADFFVKYAVQDLASYTTIWQTNNKQFTRLLKTIEQCTAKGIRFIVVLPPVHQSVMNLAVKPNGIDTQMLPLIEKLHQSSADMVLDFEFENPLDYADTQFYDGFHLEFKRGLPEFLTLLFTQIK